MILIKFNIFLLLIMSKDKPRKEIISYVNNN